MWLRHGEERKCRGEEEEIMNKEQGTMNDEFVFLLKSSIEIPCSIFNLA